MKIRVIGSTCPDYQLPVEEAMFFAGHSAGICYMQDEFDTILNEPEEKTMKRFDQTAGSGHHSVAGHTSYNLLLTGVPKIIAMILNNEKDYNTSEKSARYTRMQLDGEELRLYNKWYALFYEMIRGTYPKLDDKTMSKLAQENARYFISVFTPSTTMEYTVDFRQGNYLIGFLEDFADDTQKFPHDFMNKLREPLRETAKLFRSVLNCEKIRDRKGRSLSLFATRQRSEYFGEVYSVNYTGSFAQLAQAHRHRSINYEMMMPDLSMRQEFFIPPIIRGEPGLMETYLEDMKSVQESFPQGMMVKINERGTPEDFLTSKCSERLCGAAQLEICLQTRRTLDRYVSTVIQNGETEVFKMLYPLQGKTKCQFTIQPCVRPCPLGQEHAFDRKI